jgi:hypothetical protein
MQTLTATSAIGARLRQRSLNYSFALIVALLVLGGRTPAGVLRGGEQRLQTVVIATASAGAVRVAERLKRTCTSAVLAQKRVRQPYALSLPLDRDFQCVVPSRPTVR